MAQAMDQLEVQQSETMIAKGIAAERQARCAPNERNGRWEFSAKVLKANPNPMSEAVQLAILLPMMTELQKIGHITNMANALQSTVTTVMGSRIAMM